MRGLILLILGAVLAVAMTGAALARHGGRGGEHNLEGNDRDKVEQGEQQRQPVPDKNQPGGNACSSPGGAEICG
jgi:hypothetical protein